MLEEDPLHPVVPALGNLEVIGRIEIKKRDGLDRTVHVERAGVDHLVGARGSLLGTVGVEFDAAALTLDAGGDGGKGVAFADTRVQSHEPRRELEMLTDTLCLRRGKRVVPETDPGFDSQDGILLSFFVHTHHTPQTCRGCYCRVEVLLGGAEKFFPPS